MSKMTENRDAEPTPLGEPEMWRKDPLADIATDSIEEIDRMRRYLRGNHTPSTKYDRDIEMHLDRKSSALRGLQHERVKKSSDIQMIGLEELAIETETEELIRLLGKRSEALLGAPDYTSENFASDIGSRVKSPPPDIYQD